MKDLTDEEKKAYYKLNDDPESEDPLRIPLDWRRVFPPQILKEACSEKTQKKVWDVVQYGNCLEGRFKPDKNDVKKYGKPAVRYYQDPAYYVRINSFPRNIGDKLDPSLFSCNCSEGRKRHLCVHEAAVFYALEQENDGLLVLEERTRLYQERRCEVRRKKYHRKAEELKKQYGTERVPALDFFRGRQDSGRLCVYDMQGALKDFFTDRYSMAMAEKILKSGDRKKEFHMLFHEIQNRSGERCLAGELEETDAASEADWYATGQILMTGDILKFAALDGWRDFCEPVHEIRDDDKFLNINALVMCSLLWDEADRIAGELGDFTDDKATKFFKNLETEEKKAVKEEYQPADERTRTVELFPRIIVENGEAALSFRIARKGGRAIVVRRIPELVTCHNHRKKMELSKKESIDFSRETLTEQSMPVFDFLQRRVGEVKDVNDKFEMRYGIRTLNVTSSLELKGALLDNFYDACEGQLTEYQDKTNNIKEEQIPVGHHDIRLALTADRLTDARGTFAGVAVHGIIPVLLKGSGSHRYVLNREGLSRISREERDMIRPFESVADESGYFRFQVGLDHLQEFYYRVVPKFLESSCVDFTDNAEEEAEKLLPPEPHFDFWLDCEDMDAMEPQECEERLASLHDIPNLKKNKAAGRGAKTSSDADDKAGRGIGSSSDADVPGHRRKKGARNLLTMLVRVQYQDQGASEPRSYILSPLRNAGQGADTPRSSASSPQGRNGQDQGAHDISRDQASHDTGRAQDAHPVYRDTVQENRVLEAAQEIMPCFIRQGGNAADALSSQGAATADALSPQRTASPQGVAAKTAGDRVTAVNTASENAEKEETPQRLARTYFAALLTDDGMFDFLRRDIARLEHYGDVKGTDAFRKHAIRKVPQMKLGISVESGIMDLSLTSAGLSEEELLAVLRSYHRKKRFHRLSSGDYIDLSDDAQIRDMDSMLSGLDLTPEELAQKSVQMPLYRALYVDRMLEEHEDIVSSRDRVYRALIRNFRSINDADIEPPESLTDVLRTYQTYGFKWIKTLESAGFGGILADEMGLGKTLQMISVLLSDYQTGTVKDPSLIICPASLVYNWQEEFARFAPDIVVTPIAGGAATRRKALGNTDTQVYVISYDLLKRNIASFADRSFFYVVLDEAQYIKNAGAAVTKSVKTLHAAHRFALTGTPIENRLAELWSIFDFLMPGFLYGRKDFEQQLEIPITKYKDEAATEKLKKMTAPFILRRRKNDVLRDLPDKMEEVRYVRISGEQQKLYDAEVVRLKNLIGTQDDNGGKIKIFAELTRIRQICCDPALLFDNYSGESAKREAVMGLIRQAMDGGHRMLLFSQFTSMLALLEEDLRKEGIPYYLLTGATPKEKRIQMVHAFNEGDTPIFLISLKAGGTGLNLTGADVVIHYDPWWNLAAQNQATDRAHRIGQTRQVTVYRLIMRGTIEEKILKLQETKRDLAESVLTGDNRSITSLSKEELMELLA